MAPPTVLRKATKHDARHSNLRTALQVVATHRSTSRAAIARTTGLTRATVSSLVAELIEEGLVREAGPGESAGGKPPTLLELNGNGREIVALDISRHPFTGAVIDLAGTFRHRTEGPDRPLTGDEAVEVLLGLADDLTAQADAPILGVGVGTPGVVDPEGLVVEASHLHWRHLPLGRLVSERTGHPATVLNDARAAALAEYRRHPTRSEHLVLVKLGRGIGAGVVLGGSPFAGDHFAAGEIGHISVVPDGDLCDCGNRGCLETVAAAPSILRSISGTDDPGVPWDALALARRYGEDSVRQALAVAGRHLGRVLASLVSVLDVSTVVIASEIANTGDILLEAVRSELHRTVLPAVAGRFRVRLAEIGDRVVLAGVADAVLHDRLGVVLR